VLVSVSVSMSMSVSCVVRRVCARVRVRARARARVCDVLARFAHVYGPLWGECVRGFLARELLVSWPL
jgi:hypothetical protein